MSLYLGLDSSTQSLTGVVIEVDGSVRRVVYRRSLSFDAEFPEYGTRNGVFRGDDPLVVTSSPEMWAAALDRFMSLLGKESGLDVSRLCAVAGAAQQHGSVYLNAGASACLSQMVSSRPLADVVRSLLSRSDSPVWLDSSTSAQCAAITESVGGSEALARLTGSRAFERFTGPQIRRYSEAEPEGWSETDRVHLVSSFLASLLIGAHAPIEPGDGAGMNLMDIAERRWAPAALAATAPDLERRLPRLVESSSVIGRLSPYWVERHGLPPASVIAWTGDNPSTLIGIGLVDPDRIAISLGTSDTVFRLTHDSPADLTGASHVFGAPTGDFMALVCFSNGSLAREAVLQSAGVDWDGFAAALRATPPGNHGGIMLPWFVPEITPPVPEPSVHRYALAAADSAANVRAVIEAQMMATAVYSDRVGPRAQVIHATGGAAQNRDILQVMADIHGAEVHRYEAGEAAALGAALRAWHGYERAAGRTIDWPDILRDFAVPVGSPILPDARNVALYGALRGVYSACEAHALGRGPDPWPVIEAFRSAYSQ